MSLLVSSPPVLQRPIYRGHIPELDAVRGIGIGLVLIDHFWPKSLGLLIFSLGHLGWIAMDSFFVLSGFLITGILVDTRSRPDYFSNYYIRRSLRIFPLYYLVLLAILILTHISQGGHGAENAMLIRQWGSPAWFYFYLGNFRIAHAGAWPAVASYAPLWSLQIEEQFYLLLPLAVRWMRLDHLSRLLWCMVILSPAIRVLFFLHNPNNPFPQFVLLPCHMEGLALGALIAIRFRTGPWAIREGLLAVLTSGLLLIVCVASLISKPILADQMWSSPFDLLAGISLSSFACAGLLLSLIVFRGSRWTPAVAHSVHRVHCADFLRNLLASSADAACFEMVAKIGDPSKDPVRTRQLHCAGRTEHRGGYDLLVLH